MTDRVESTPSLLHEAAEIIYGDREKAYGDPGVNCRRIAAIWGVVLGVPVTDEQVCLCMIGLKLARLVHTPDHHDSQVDLAGYAALLERIQASKQKKEE